MPMEERKSAMVHVLPTSPEVLDWFRRRDVDPALVPRGGVEVWSAPTKDEPNRIHVRYTVCHLDSQGEIRGTDTRDVYTTDWPT